MLFKQTGLPNKKVIRDAFEYMQSVQAPYFDRQRVKINAEIEREVLLSNGGSESAEAKINALLLMMFKPMIDGMVNEILAAAKQKAVSDSIKSAVSIAKQSSNAAPNIVAAALLAQYMEIDADADAAIQAGIKPAVVKLAKEAGRTMQFSSEDMSDKSDYTAKAAMIKTMSLDAKRIVLADLIATIGDTPQYVSAVVKGVEKSLVGYVDTLAGAFGDEDGSDPEVKKVKQKIQDGFNGPAAKAAVEKLPNDVIERLKRSAEVLAGVDPNLEAILVSIVNDLADKGASSIRLSANLTVQEVVVAAPAAANANQPAQKPKRAAKGNKNNQPKR